MKNALFSPPSVKGSQKSHFRRFYGFLLFAGLFLPSVLKAQTDFQNHNQTYVGELGVEAGGAQYFGDLNPSGSWNTLKPAAGIFYRYFINTYFGVSAHLHFAQLGYSDVYNSNTFQQLRNLSFNTNIWDFSLQGDFNFFRFEPGSRSYRFTPYLTAGIGVFHFDPYAYYQDRKYYLQPLGTEGQGSAQYPGRKPYNLWSFDIPFGMGVKYNLNRNWNIALSATYHLTGTDYLDDVSTTYAGPEVFLPGGSNNGKSNIAYILQDRSFVYGNRIGQKGRERGNSRDKDKFLYVEISLSYLFTTYHCPEF